MVQGVCFRVNESYLGMKAANVCCEEAAVSSSDIGLRNFCEEGRAFVQNLEKPSSARDWRGWFYEKTGIYVYKFGEATLGTAGAVWGCAHAEPTKPVVISDESDYRAWFENKIKVIGEEENFKRRIGAILDVANGLRDDNPYRPLARKILREKVNNEGIVDRLIRDMFSIPPPPDDRGDWYINTDGYSAGAHGETFEANFLNGRHYFRVNRLPIGQIALILGEIGNIKAVEPLILGLQEFTYGELLISKALGKLKDRRAISPLLKVLIKMDFEARARAEAAKAIGLIGDSSSIGSLKVQLAQEKDPTVRGAIILALKDLGVTYVDIQQVASKDKQGPVVAVLMGAKRGASPALKSLNVKLASVLRDAVVNTNRFQVIDEGTQITVLKEQKRSLSECFEDSCRVEIGRLLSAQRLMVGNIEKFGKGYQISLQYVDLETGVTKYSILTSCECNEEQQFPDQIYEITGQLMNVMKEP